MSPSLGRSESVNQTSRPTATPSISRSVSCSQTFNNTTQNSSSTSTYTHKIHNLDTHVKECLTDAMAQVDAFKKEYPQYWDLGNTTILIRYDDAEKRLPRIASQLGDCNLKSLLFVKNTLGNMKNDLTHTLKPIAQNDGALSLYLERAEHATANAISLYLQKSSYFHFEKSEQKDLHLSNDIMSAAVIIKQYFAGLISDKAYN